MQFIIEYMIQDEMGRACSMCMGMSMRNAYKIIVRKPE